MGGQSVPSSTAQYQQVATGIWGSPQATALATPVLKPAMQNIKERQDMLMGFQSGDPAQTRKFLGLPPTATQDEAVHAISQLNKPVTSTAQFQQPTKTAAHGGIMALYDEPTQDPRKFAKGGSSSAPQDITAAQSSKLAQLQKLVSANKKLTPTQKKQYDSWTAQRNTFQDYTTQQNTIQQAATAQGLTPAGATFGQAGYFGFDPTSYAEAAKTGNLAGTTTNPLYAQAIKQLQGMSEQPKQFDQATQAYQDAISGLKSAAGYTPQTVTADKVTAEGYDPSMATASTYDAATMAAPKEVQAQGYDAAQATAARMTQPADVTGQTYQAANIVPTARETAATTAGPKSWTDPGVAQQYMNPYQQAVIDQAKYESNRDYMQNLNALRGGAAKSGAYGGSRQALQEAEAMRGQNRNLSNIETQGLQQAYSQGMGQFQAEQGLGAQVGMSNTQAINQLKSQYMSMGLTEAQANQAAQNAAAQFGAQSAQTAALANQQAGLTTGQANLSAAQQTALANQNAINQQRSQYVTQALQAAQANQQAALTTEQQNAIMQNAANQFNAQNQTQISQINAASQNAAGQFLAGAKNQTALANQQAALQAALQNQQAGLQADQQNIGALSQIGSMGQGLGSLGSTIGNYGQNLANMWGQAGSTLQGLGSNWYNQSQTNAANVWGGPTSLANQGINTLSGMGGGQSGVTTQATKQG